MGGSVASIHFCQVSDWLCIVEPMGCAFPPAHFFQTNKEKARPSGLLCEPVRMAPPFSRVPLAAGWHTASGEAKKNREKHKSALKRRRQKKGAGEARARRETVGRLRG
nr:hypothetical protein [Pandoravirus massiliensis]